MNSTPAAVSGLNSEDSSHTVSNDSDSRHPARRLPCSAGIFLMTNSFERGGSERQFVELSRSLQAASFKVNLGCLQPKGPFREEVGAVEHFTLGGSLFGLQSLRSRYRLAGYMRREGIAVAHAFDYYTNLTLIPAAKLARTPVVMGSFRQLGDLLTPVQRRAQQAMFRWADCVICNSRAAADNLLRNGIPAKQLAVIGNGLPPVAFAEAVPLVARRPAVFRVGMIARMNARSKNHRMMLEVAVRLRGRVRNCEIVLVGDGPLRVELERAAEELRVSDVVQFLGDCRDVQSVLASLDVTVLPSASESLSNAILESMAAGVPVIANQVGGNVELISDDRGILVPPDDVEGLATALERISADAPRREAMGRNAQKFARENFTGERMRKKHEELYAQLLERKGWRYDSSVK
jgi:L-malate glycosyltransferase